jgi:hypothetical protein
MTDWGEIGKVIVAAASGLGAAFASVWAKGKRKGTSVSEERQNGHKPGTNWLEEVRRVVGEVVGATETRLREEIQTGMAEMRKDRENLWGEVNKSKDKAAAQAVDIAVLKAKADERRA